MLRILIWLTTIWTAIGVSLWLVYPKMSPLLLQLCIAAPLAWYWIIERRLPWYRPSLMFLILLLAGCYLLITLSWSPLPWSALVRVMRFFVVVSVLYIVLNALPRLGNRVIAALAIGFIIGLTLGGAFLCFEILSGQVLRQFLMQYVPYLQPDANGLKLDADRLILAPYLTNSSVGILTLLFFPAALIAHRFSFWDRHRIALLAAFSCAAVAIYASSHDSSKAAFTAGIAVLALFRLRPCLGKGVVLAGWLAANLCVVPVTTLLYDAEIYRATWLPESWRHRIVIWGYTANQVANAPFLGAGVQAARAAMIAGDPEPVFVPGTTFELSTSWHSHSVYLQLWYETGVVGALICLSIGLTVLWHASKARSEARPYLFATFAAAAVVAAFSYGIWAPWFMASLAMVGIFGALATAVPEVPPRDLRDGTFLRKPTILSLVCAMASIIAVSTALLVSDFECRITLDPHQIAPEAGFAYIAAITTNSAFLHPRPGDSKPEGYGSNLKLFENGSEIGPPHSLHKSIREKGAGRFSHWGPYLYFSSSDNTDPRRNGRQYAVEGTMALKPIVAWGAGVLSGAIVLACWGLIRGASR